MMNEVMSLVVEAAPATEAVRAQVERILQSPGFRSSGVLRHLLTYLADKCISGEADNLKEYSIGLDALGKPPSFDPRQESVVRMHTARLRQKLADYYRAEGIEDPIVVDLPKGGFRLTFEKRQLQVVGDAGPPQAKPAWWSSRKIIGAAILAVVLLSAAAASIRFWPARQNESASAAWTPELQELWAPLLSSNRLVVCMATPLFVDVPGFGTIRDSSVNDWDNVGASKGLSSVEKALGAGMSQPSYDYTEAGTATGAFLLGQFLAPRKQNVTITRANLLSWQQIAEDNVVFLGPATGIHQTQDMPVDARLALDPTGVRNLDPRPGEPAFMADRPGLNGEESGLSYALISRVPAMNGHGAILMLSGNQISSVTGSVQAFTNPAIARAIVSKLRNSSGKIPPYFQVVLSVKSMDEVPVEISYQLHRELRQR
jgi:hypothetical protein